MMKDTPLLRRLLHRLLEKISFRCQYLLGYAYGTATLATEVEACVQLLGSGNLKLVVDAGANKGEWTRELLRQVRPAAVHCFEPSRHCQAFFTDLPANVTVHPQALSDRSGMVTLFADAPISGMASLVKRDLRSHGLRSTAQEKVRTTTLDKEFYAAGETLDLVKIDVEGHELAVLQGAAKLLKARRIRGVLFEFGGTGIDARVFFRDYWNLLSDNGFELWRITPLGPLPVRAYSQQLESFIISNYVARLR